MKDIIIIIIFLSFSSIITAQNIEPCGTMKIYEIAKKENPKADSIMNAFERSIQEWIKENKPFNNYHQNEYPLIEGFIPTGNPEIDKINFGIAKQTLYDNNPDKYKAMTRKINNEGNGRTIK